jgi:hypothetical protein
MTTVFHRHPTRIAAAAIALALVCAGTHPAVAASSANYCLTQDAFAAGNPNQAAVPSAGTRMMVAASLGGIAGPVEISSHYLFFPGFLFPELWGATGYLDILSMSITAGRVYLTWRAVPDATGYQVFSTNRMDRTFPEDLSGVFDDTTWNAPLPAEPKFYRVKATTP